VGTSLKDPDLVRRVNINGTKNVLQAVKQLSPGTQVLVASSADIYGAKANEYSGRPLPELPLVDALPQNPYAISKLDMERMIVDEFNDFVIRVRPFPHIGPGQKLGFVTADFASQIAAIETGRQESTMQVGNLKAERDFTDVRDVVRAYRLLLEQGQVGEVYHVATGQGTSIQSILDQLVALSGMQITVEQDAERMRPSDIPSLIGDASKLQAATGWKPAIGLADSLKDILEYWRRAQ
jgi:GDP-4-dehydro-6-deoxy-D-mannose reductase